MINKDNRSNKFEVEDLIDYEKYLDRYDEMPPMCQAIVEQEEKFFRIGHNDNLGWFITGNEGYCVLWSEKHNKK